MIVLSADHDTVAAELLAAIQKNGESHENGEGKIFPPKIQRLFGKWQQTDFGHRCCGEVCYGRKKRSVVLEIGRLSGVHITEVPGNDINFFKWSVDIGSGTDQHQLQRYANRTAKQILKDAFPPVFAT